MPSVFSNYIFHELPLLKKQNELYSKEKLDILIKELQILI